MNVYGPNKDDASFFEKLEYFIKEIEDKDIISGGDYNTKINNEKDIEKMVDLIHTKYVRYN